MNTKTDTAASTAHGHGRGSPNDSYPDLPNRGPPRNGVEYAYRDTGPTGRPASARPAAALPRQPRQLGSRAHRRARFNRRVITFDNAGVGGSTGTTPSTSRRWPTTRSPSSTPSTDAGRPARVLDRQLRGPGDRADPPRPRATAGARVRRPAGRSRHARLGAGGHRRGREPAAQARAVPRRVLHPVRRQQQAGRHGPQPHDPARTERPGRAATTWQTRQAQYDAVCAWGIPNHALLQRLERPRRCRCSWPTATATR